MTSVWAVFAGLMTRITDIDIRSLPGETFADTGGKQKSIHKKCYQQNIFHLTITFFSLSRWTETSVFKRPAIWMMIVIFIYASGK